MSWTYDDAPRVLSTGQVACLCINDDLRNLRCPIHDDGLDPFEELAYSFEER